jgi:hypothetical protein
MQLALVPQRAVAVMAIISLHAALIFRRFFGPEPSFPFDFRFAAPAPAAPASALKAASGSAAMRNNSCDVNFRAFFMDSTISHGNA